MPEKRIFHYLSLIFQGIFPRTTERAMGKKIKRKYPKYPRTFSFSFQMGSKSSPSLAIQQTSFLLPQTFFPLLHARSRVVEVEKRQRRWKDFAFDLLSSMKPRLIEWGNESGGKIEFADLIMIWYRASFPMRFWGVDQSQKHLCKYLQENQEVIQLVWFEEPSKLSDL